METNMDRKNLGKPSARDPPTAFKLSVGSSPWLNNLFQPNIQTPEFSLLSDWTTLDPSLPDYEISMNLIEEKLEKYFNRFVKMKDERHLNFSFALYSSITCLFGIFIGQKISGIYLFYLAFILVTAVPIIFRDEILGTIYGPIFRPNF